MVGLGGCHYLHEKGQGARQADSICCLKKRSSGEGILTGSSTSKDNQRADMVSHGAAVSNVDYATTFSHPLFPFPRGVVTRGQYPLGKGKKAIEVRVS